MSVNRHCSVSCAVFGMGVFFCLIAGCRQEGSSPRIDPRFSFEMTIAGYASSETVDLISIYQVRDNPSCFRSLSALSRLHPTMRIQDRVHIRKMMSALAQDPTVKSIMGAYERRESLAYHIVFTDYESQRVGYAIVRIADVNGDERGVVQSIQPGGGNCIYYNKPILKILRGVREQRLLKQGNE